jgi:hypothetical protein
MGVTRDSPKEAVFLVQPRRVVPLGEAKQLNLRVAAAPGYGLLCCGCQHPSELHGLRRTRTAPHTAAARAARAETEPGLEPVTATCQWTGCRCDSWDPGVYQPTLWVEVTVAPGWVAAYRLVRDGGRPVVGELRLFPAEPEQALAQRPDECLRFWDHWWPRRPRAAGLWVRGELLGRLAPVPRGGLTGRVLRRVRVGAYIRALSGWRPPREFLPGWQAAADDAAATMRPTSHALDGLRRGRPPRPDVVYARVAAAYVELVDRRDPAPVKTLARRHGWKRGQVYEWIRIARTRGLLEKTTRSGLPGGGLTKKALALLAPSRRRRAYRRPRR